MNKDSNKRCGCVKGGAVNSVFVINNSCSGPSSVNAACEEWMRAGVALRKTVGWLGGRRKTRLFPGCS